MTPSHLALIDALRETYQRFLNHARPLPPSESEAAEADTLSPLIAEFDAARERQFAALRAAGPVHGAGPDFDALLGALQDLQSLNGRAQERIEALLDQTRADLNLVGRGRAGLAAYQRTVTAARGPGGRHNPG